LIGNEEARCASVDGDEKGTPLQRNAQRTWMEQVEGHQSRISAYKSTSQRQHIRHEEPAGQSEVGGIPDEGEEFFDPGALDEIEREDVAIGLRGSSGR